METHRSRGQDESGDGEEPVVACDLRTVDRQWTPDRSSRATNETKKVRSADDGPLAGGDWVLNEKGEGATLSFCFTNPEGTECYGLTIGHLCDSVGDSVFRFAHSEPIAVPDEELEKEEYFMFEIGGVTSISTNTDSLVFQMELQPDDYHPMRIALSSQSHITLDEDLVSLIKTPSIGSTVIGFGAQRRGAMCLVHDPSKSSSGAYSFQGDIGLRSSGPATEASTDGGDCGTIFCSVENGAPLYFHHVLSRLSDDTKLSYGVPFLEVLNAHPETRHLVPAASSGDKEGEPKKKKGKISGSPSAEAHEVSGLRQFQAKVMDRPTGSNTDSLTVSAQTEGSNASLPLNARGGFKTYDDGVEDQTLPIFNVRKKKYSQG
jgi:hypothetical protein